MQLIKIDRNFRDREKLFALNDEAFPVEERIPSDKLLGLIESIDSDAWGLYDGDEFVGFALMTTDSETKLCYLGFFAIDSRFRSRGYGTQALHEFHRHYDGYQIILDMELMDDETADNMAQRERRLDFYQRNGFKRAMLRIAYLGMEYELMCSQDELRLKDFEKLLSTMDIPGFEPVVTPL